MIDTYRKALMLLSARERRRGTMVLAMVVVMAGLETVGLASIMPFLAVLGNAELIETNPLLSTLYAFLGAPSVDAFLMTLGFAAFAMLLFSAVFRIVTHYAMNRFIEMRRHSIGERLLETYLRQPYSFFLNRHSSELATSILSEVDQLIQNVYRPGMYLIANSIVAFALIALLVLVNPVLAVSVALVIGGAYVIIFFSVRGILGRKGRARAIANRERFTAAGEALAGVKDIKLMGREQAYLSRFRTPSIRQARFQATNTTLAMVPKFLIEAVGIGGVIAVALVLLAGQGGVAAGALGGVLPLLGIYALAGYRLLPAAQQIYSGMSRLQFGAGAVQVIHDDMLARETLAELPRETARPLAPREAIFLESVSYTYPNAPGPALKNINLTIPVRSTVGFIGTTGSGKTTLVDVILGLLRPQEGVLRVDEQPVDEENLRAWQQALGYVPQDIFLTDSSIAENIALGVASEHIDHSQVARCAKLAQVHDFIADELPSGYATLVGERGVRLSGGQRQRIGIARALYHDPEVLVFDEATSALDTATERAVMNAIESFTRKKTIIIVAHRLSTIRLCDNIYVLDDGRIAGEGPPDAVGKESSAFMLSGGA